MAVAGLGSMRNVAKQRAQTVMRAAGLLQALGECGRLANELRRGIWHSNTTHGQPNDAVTHDSLVSWRNKSFRRGNQYRWQLQKTNRNMFNRHAAREHLPYPCTYLQNTSSPS
jgi:hypothetical protein